MNNDHQDTDTMLAYLRGQLSEEETTLFAQRLMESNDLRQQLLELSIEEETLTEWARTQRVMVKLDDDVYRDDQSTFPSPTPTQSSSTRSRVPWLAAAAAVTFAFIALGWSMRDRDDNKTLVQNQGVAQLVAAVDAIWQGAPRLLETPLEVGEYNLQSGSVDMIFSDGARVSVRGPALFDIKSPRHIHLLSGNLVAKIPDEALGFVVTSPQSEVVDLGTEFGLSVNDQGQTDVHVLDGLVEVLPMEGVVSSPGVMITEGQARRFEQSPEAQALEIPVASRESLLGNHSFDKLGLQMLRGSVRISESLSRDDLTPDSERTDCIVLVAEKHAVQLEEALEVTIHAPGKYRSFGGISYSIPAGTRVNSYLLHFRASSREQVHGVIKFKQPIVGILSTDQHLSESDSLFAQPEIYYPKGKRPARGLEPSTHGASQSDLNPDEIVLSQDRHALAIHTKTDPNRGIDQVRILTLASDSAE